MKYTFEEIFGLVLGLVLIFICSACGRVAEVTAPITACGIPARVAGAPNGKANVSLRYALDNAKTQGCCATEAFNVDDLGELLYSHSACQITMQADAVFIDCWAISNAMNRPSYTTDTCEWNHPEAL